MDIQKITGRTSDKIRHCARLFSDRAARYSEGLFVIEGMRLCREAALCGTEIDTLFFTEDFSAKHPDVIAELLPLCAAAYETSGDALKKMSDTVSPQGIVCICRMKTAAQGGIKPGGLYAAMEDVSDPSNIGAISRSAAAFDFDGLMLAGRCADPYSPKALRASMGALLRLPLIMYGSAEEMISAARKNGLVSYAGVLSADSRDIRDISFADGAVIMVGNEGRGLSGAAANAADIRVRIPMSARTESLNAAAAASVMMWEAWKSRS